MPLELTIWLGRFVDSFSSNQGLIVNLQCKYRKAAHMKIALASGALGEKMMVDSIFNCLVNDQGTFLYACAEEKSQKDMT